MGVTSEWTLDPDFLWAFTMADNGDYRSAGDICVNCRVLLDQPLGWRASARMDPYLLPVMLCTTCAETHRPDLLEFRDLAVRVRNERGLHLYHVLTGDPGRIGCVVRPDERRMTTLAGTYQQPLTLAQVREWLEDER